MSIMGIKNPHAKRASKNLAFVANYTKIHREFGTLKNFSQHFGLDYRVLENTINRKETTRFRNFKTLKIINAMIDGGYLDYSAEFKKEIR